jgi:hypothetical protein
MQIVSSVNVKYDSLASKSNSGQPGESPFPPSPQWINEERRDEKELHVHRQVPRLTHALYPRKCKFLVEDVLNF